MITSSVNANITKFDVSNGIAYVGLPGVLRLIDVSNPTSPTELSTLPFNSQFNPNPSSIEVAGDLALFGVENRLEIIDVSDPISPTHLATFDAGEPFIINQILYNVVYLAGLSDALVVDLKVPDQPALASALSRICVLRSNQAGIPGVIYTLAGGLEIYRPYPPAIPGNRVSHASEIPFFLNNERSCTENS